MHDAEPALPGRTVDLFIPTYNEPFEVLEKTITGALCLDYPHARVWILDDDPGPYGFAARTSGEGSELTAEDGTPIPPATPQAPLKKGQKTGTWTVEKPPSGEPPAQPLVWTPDPPASEPPSAAWR